MNVRNLAIATLCIAMSAAAVAQSDDHAPDLRQRPSEQPSQTLPPTIDHIPVGTNFELQLQSELSTSTARINDQFSGILVQAVVLNNTVVIPSGSLVKGRVADVTPTARRFRHRVDITLRPDLLVTPDGHMYSFDSQMIDTWAPKDFKLSSEGALSNSARHYGRMAEIGAGVGGVAGAVVGGGVGAMAGAGIGAALPGVSWAAQNDVVMLPANSRYWFETTTPVRPTVSLQNSAQVQQAAKDDDGGN